MNEERENVLLRDAKKKGEKKKVGGGLYFLPGSLLLATPLLPPVYPPCAGEAKFSCAVAET